ncbi:MAG TPA: N-methyl-L-tryptophan oxidase [Deinococcales bacterium]|nr:N-methyl-L-tryptophan oxidase [Deinococcales bacterium]
MRHYDTIVIGVGGMGSAALHQLARRGRRVLGLERFDLGHAMGSSHGVNRIIRLAYFEDARYVPLLREAYETWRETERLAGERLLFVTGGLDLGPEDGQVVQGALDACRTHDLPHEVLTAAEIAALYPAFRLPGGHAGVYQPDGGFVASERAIMAHVSLAMANGAEVHAREKVIALEPQPGRVTVVTDQARYEAGSVVVSAGAWVSDLLPGLSGTAVPERQVLGWFQPKRPELFSMGRFPISILEADFGHFYQFPTWGVPGLKIGKHHHRREHGHADLLSREATPADEAELRDAVRAFFPDADGPTLRLTACLYTNTPDENFILDRLPGHPEVIVASPCSGHGFKFSSVIGKILADLATSGESPLDLSLFRYGRFATG